MEEYAVLGFTISRWLEQHHGANIRVVRLVQEAEMSDGNTRLLVVLHVLGEVVGVRLGPVAARRARDAAEVPSLKAISNCPG